MITDDSRAPQRGSRPSADVLADVSEHPSVQHAVAAVRELLGVDVAFTTEFEGAQHTFRIVDGDRESFGLVPDLSVPIEATYCPRVLAGELPHLMPDVLSVPVAAAMPITEFAGIGAFVSVPIVRSDGETYGTLCAANHRARADLDERDVQFMRVLARLVADSIERDQLVQARREAEQQADAATALLAAVACRDEYTGEHSEAVVELSRLVAVELGLDEAEVDEVAQVALLHDIGKLGIPDSVLQKRGPLDSEEWEVMKTHPARSAELLAAVPALAHLRDAVRAEHERWDGGGYPDGLAGERIPRASRITLACDAYHAMTSDRPYRKAMPPEEARRELAAGQGTQFCPTTVPALLRVLDDRPEPSPLVPSVAGDAAVALP